ncbi:MAG TPA: hypothetical protein VEL79_16200, partial [Vicinamibacterales bacterium]|nr:hypothetical protein [Vicinamibacterales bacterium]
ALRGRDKPDQAELRVFFDGLRDLEIELVVAAADSLARRAEYGFPKLPDWRREAQRIHTERAAAQRAFLRRLRDPLCSDCGDTGVRYLEAGPTAHCRHAPRVAAPCPCRDQRRVELLGRVPPPALPAGAERDDRPITHDESAAIVTRLAREGGAPLLKPMPTVPRIDTD